MPQIAPLPTKFDPQIGEYILIQTPTGLKVRRVDRRVKDPTTAEKCLQCNDVLYPFRQCRPLGWLPRVGLSIRIINMPWHQLNGYQGTIIRLHSLKGMPLADVRISGKHLDLEAQLTWLEPLEKS